MEDNTTNQEKPKKTSAGRPKGTQSKTKRTYTQPKENAETIKSEPKQFIPKEVDLHQYITVLNGFQGKLIYKSKKTGETFVWNEFGAEQEIELLELRNAKNSSKGFFINNWFMFKPEDSWVINYLGMNQYYKHAIPINKFDEIFELSPTELKKKISQLSEGQKKSVAYRAMELISEHKIDSLSTITALEEALNIQLIEK